MIKLMTVAPAGKEPPLCRFFSELEEKQRQKLFDLFLMLMQMPAEVMREPYVKHFSLERYHALYELRIKAKILVRIIFSIEENGNILFLTPFVKRRKRDTMQALEASLGLLAQVEDGSCSVQELSIHFFINGGKAL